MKQNISTIFSEAKLGDRKSQKWLYEHFSGKMLGVAYSYVGDRYDAEDIMLSAFYKAFKEIERCESVEHFQYWLRKVVVNDSISFIRKKKKLMYIDTDWAEDYEEEISEETEQINIEEIFAKMPLGYKLVFNLAVFEEKKHSEIAEILNISEGTSKSQLNKAKRWIKEYLIQNKDNEKLKI